MKAHVTHVSLYKIVHDMIAGNFSLIQAKFMSRSIGVFSFIPIQCREENY